nr:glycosyltransferase family 9 protein [uncultured Mucilaginibacter sp.]
MAAKKKILIYRLGSLGDTVMALPVFHQIRQAYPNADITLLTNNPVVSKAAPLTSVLGEGYFFDRVLAYPVGTRNALVLLKLLNQIRALQIDTLIYLAGVRTLRTLFKTKLVVFRDWCFFKCAGVKNTIGFPVILPDFELSADPATGNLEWEAKRLARRAKALGIINLDDDRYWDLKFTAEELETARKKLSAIAAGQPIIAASTGTKNQVNHWEAGNWHKMLRQLSQLLPGWTLVMIGGPDEFEQAGNCIEAWGGAAINLCGQTSPRVSGAVLKQAKAFIGHDSGPMHLAAAVGTPCTAIFSARHFPRQWYPRGSFNNIIYHKTDCAGCELDVCIAQQKKCILSITVDEVVNAVMEVLKRNPSTIIPDK